MQLIQINRQYEPYKKYISFLKKIDRYWTEAKITESVGKLGKRKLQAKLKLD